MKSLSMIAITAALAGCVSPDGFNRAMSYPSSYTNVRMPDDTYRVFEHKIDKTLMTTPSIGKAIGPGVVQGATLGLVEHQEPIEGHRAAARRYLDTTGKSGCEIVSGYVIAGPQHEFMYRCP